MPDVIVPDLDSEIIEKAMIKTKTWRESDMRGHLANDDDKTSASRAVLMQIFWDDKAADKSDHSPLAKMLRNDFQLLQAYNYLRSWKVIKSF